MSKQREAGELKLKNRVKRLARLVEINAPVIVMATEAQMIMDALWLMDADAVGMSLARREGERVSKAAGFVDEDEARVSSLRHGTFDVGGGRALRQRYQRVEADGHILGLLLGELERGREGAAGPLERAAPLVCDRQAVRVG